MQPKPNKPLIITPLIYHQMWVELNCSLKDIASTIEKWFIKIKLQLNLTLLLSVNPLIIANKPINAKNVGK